MRNPFIDDKIGDCVSCTSSCPSRNLRPRLRQLIYVTLDSPICQLISLCFEAAEDSERGALGVKARELAPESPEYCDG